MHTSATRTRTVIAATVAAAAALGLAGPAGARDAAGEGAGGSKPAVNMERLLLAAQLDGFRNNNANTAGAKSSVKLVQRGLRAKGYDVGVDGNFGSQTATAYSKWQTRSTGATGIGANGLPGETSLKALAKGRFRVTKIVRTGTTSATYGGSRVNLRTKRMLIAAAHRLGRTCELDLTQGSYSSSVSDSAQTHSGGGAVDVNVGVRCGHTVKQVVRALRAVGFAAWHRTPSQGFDAAHIHAIAISDPDLSTPIAPGGFTAMHQVAAWAKKEDGLSYPTAAKLRRNIVTWEQYGRAH